MSKTVKTFVSIGVVIVLVLATIRVSYSHFTENLSGDNSGVSIINTKNGKLEVAFSGGNSIEISNVNAGNDPVYTKTFSVKGTNFNEQDLNYILSLVIDENSYNSINFSLASYNPISNGYIIPNIDSTKVNLGKSTISLGNGYFNNADGVVHTYTIKFYLNNNENGNLKAHIEAFEG